ncbi:TetR/AcrR family transcriptional regulator [Orenia marismortui]|uniref:TetR family transcriptional regulator n=1 Tax=Orenia marismortui TaxID=46469 RepID=A0A4V3GY86_9FIRM|nr:TetR/AcrR family transcriptional regulator [Orenia marismortui]TDX51159.1 TetR family transcriptional regulator [Orenia marismortui]
MHPKKEKIFEAAIEKFAKKGTTSTTMQEIAKAAGIGKGTLYRYFENKEDLIFSLIEFRFNIIFEKVKADIIKLDDPIQKIEKVIDAHLNFCAIHGVNKFLIREVWGYKSKFKNAIQEMMSLYTGFIKDIIEEGIEQGKFKEVNALNAATALIGMIDITIIRCMMFEEDFLTNKIREDIVEIYLNGMVID